MSLEKAIHYGKEHRKPYYGSRLFDSACCHQGSCKWCSNNRDYRKRKYAYDKTKVFVDISDKP